MFWLNIEFVEILMFETTLLLSTSYSMCLLLLNCTVKCFLKCKTLRTSLFIFTIKNYCLL